MRRALKGSRAIVTGASSGIGHALTLELARRGTRLVLAARRSDRLEALAHEVTALGSTALVVAGDITAARTREDLIRTAGEQLGGLDLVVNNAGVGAIGPFGDATAERLRRVMEVNFFAPVELIRAALPLLRSGRQAMIVNIASVLAHRAVPNKAEYCASKFALHGFSDALRGELAADQIDVLVVNPSTTSSEFFDRVLESSPATSSRRAGMDPRTVARATVRAIEKGRHEVVLSAGGKSLVWLDRLFPTLADILVGRFGA